MMKVEVYCDGACLGNPGPGGWAALLVAHRADKRIEKMFSGGEKHTTNNRMELSAAIEGIRAINRASHVTIYSDSQYVVRGMNEWIKNWIRNDWRTAAKKPVENVDLWQMLAAVASKHETTWKWVKGHAGHPENERVDEAARIEAEKMK
jgi:ribonuclease HI